MLGNNPRMVPLAQYGLSKRARHGYYGMHHTCDWMGHIIHFAVKLRRSIPTYCGIHGILGDLGNFGRARLRLQLLTLIRQTNDDETATMVRQGNCCFSDRCLVFVPC